MSCNWDQRIPNHHIFNRTWLLRQPPIVYHDRPISTNPCILSEQCIKKSRESVILPKIQEELQIMRQKLTQLKSQESALIGLNRYNPKDITTQTVQPSPPLPKINMPIDDMQLWNNVTSPRMLQPLENSNNSN